MKKLTLFLFLSFSFLFCSPFLIKAETPNLEENNPEQIQNDDFNMDDLDLGNIEVNSNPSPKDEQKNKISFFASISEAKKLTAMALKIIWKECKKELYNDSDKILTCAEKTKLTFYVTKKIFSELNKTLFMPMGKKIFAHLQSYKYEYATVVILTIALLKYKTINEYLAAKKEMGIISEEDWVHLNK